MNLLIRKSSLVPHRRLILALLLAVLTCPLATGAEQKKSKPGQLTGTWECMSHGAAQGDLAFTLYLEQNKEIITGSVSSPIGAGEITSGSFRNKFLELQIDTEKGNYVILGKLEKGRFSGTWSLDNGEKGTWEGEKSFASK